MKSARLAGKTTPELIAEALRDEIAAGKLQPGQPLRQDELATRFGVSRIPVREALRRLEEDGLVTVHANRGAFVTTLADIDIMEIFDMRLLLEVDLARRAVENLTGSDLDAIEAELAISDRGARTADWSKLDASFHRVLYAPAGRERQLSMVMALRGLVQRSFANEALPPRTGAWLADHHEIVEAYRAHDADGAAGLIRSHLERARQTVRDRLAAQTEDPSTGVPFYDEVRWRRAMLDLRPNCECCDRDLPNGDPDARICSFECTFCADCAENVFDDTCPNCGGNLVARPTRPDSCLDRAPASTQRVVKDHSARRARRAAAG